MADNKLFSTDTETLVLASILKSPSLIHSMDGLRFYMFSSLPNQFLFKEFEELKETNILPDPQIVISSLEAKNALDKVSGKKYIEILLSKDTNDDSFKKLVEIVVSSYRGRTFLNTLASVKKENINSETLDEMIRKTRQSLDELVGMGGGESTVHVSELVKDTYDEIVARTINPGIRGTTWGVPSVDRATGGKSPGDLIVIAGRPGSGKTSVMCNSLLQDGIAGVPSLMISREMRPQELMERLISIEAGIPSTNIRLGVMNNEQIESTRASLDRIRKMPIFLDYNFQCSNPFYLESTVNKYHNQKGVQTVYLDYIQMATERDEGQTMEIGRLTKLFKGMSNQLNMCSILASQLNRGVEQRDDKRPLLSDMRQSGAIEEDADFVIGLYREEYYVKDTKLKNIMEYIILKHRNGPTGTVPVKFDGPTYRISEA